MNYQIAFEELTENEEYYNEISKYFLGMNLF